MLHIGDMLNRLVLLRCTRNAGRFLRFYRGHFNAIWITFRTFSETFEKTKLLKFKSHLKELNCSVPSDPSLVKSKTRLNACIFWSYFLSDLAGGWVGWGGEVPLAPLGCAIGWSHIEDRLIYCLKMVVWSVPFPNVVRVEMAGQVFIK